jgi:hypothetical protein
MPGENPTPTTNCKEDRKPVIPSYIVGVPCKKLKYEKRIAKISNILCRLGYLAYNYNTTADQLIDEGTHSELK